MSWYKAVLNQDDHGIRSIPGVCPISHYGSRVDLTTDKATAGNVNVDIYIYIVDTYAGIPVPAGLDVEVTAVVLMHRACRYTSFARAHGKPTEKQSLGQGFSYTKYQLGYLVVQSHYFYQYTVQRTDSSVSSRRWFYVFFRMECTWPDQSRGEFNYLVDFLLFAPVIWNIYIIPLSLWASSTPLLLIQYTPYSALLCKLMKQ